MLTVRLLGQIGYRSQLIGIFTVFKREYRILTKFNANSALGVEQDINFWHVFILLVDRLDLIYINF